jgi:phage portal protein BeeE
MVGIGPPPNYNNIEALNQQYYAQCLQSLIEAFELCLDEGLELPKPYGTEFAIDDLLRMDTATKVKAAADGIGAGALAPNEARKRYFDLGPVAGGDSPYLQAQNYSLEALAARDAADPFAKPTPPPPTPVNADAFFVERLAYATHQKSLAVGLYDA